MISPCFREGDTVRLKAGYDRLIMVISYVEPRRAGEIQLYTVLFLCRDARLQRELIPEHCLEGTSG